MAQERITGTVKFFNKANAYGFITIDNSDREIFVHKNDVNNKQDLNQDDRVEFSIGSGKKGDVAKEVAIID